MSNRRYLVFAVLTLTVLHSGSTAVPQNGWSSIPFEEGQKVIYISNDGNDSKGEVYEVGDKVIGNDPRHPPANVKAFQSLHHDTWTRARGMESPWLMINRGDDWSVDGNSAFTHNDTTRGVVSYGSFSKPRPRITVNEGHALKIFGQTQPGYTLNGLDFRGGENPSTAVNALGEIDNITIEDNRFVGFGQGVVAQDRSENPDMNNLTIRRNVIADSKEGQGIYTKGVDGGLIEQNVIDHNGFETRDPDSSESTANIYNHNIYSAPDVTGLEIRENIIARGSSHGTTLHREGKIVDNLYIRNPIGILGRTAGQEITGNIVTEGFYITDEKQRAWGIQIGGQSIEEYRGPLLLEDNLVYFKHPDAEMVKYESPIIYEDSDLITAQDNHIWAWGKDSEPLSAAITVADYQKFLDAEASTEAFLRQLRGRRRGRWPDNYTSQAFQQWVRREMPEPGTGAAVMVGMSLLLWRRRRES